MNEPTTRLLTPLLPITVSLADVPLFAESDFAQLKFIYDAAKVLWLANDGFAYSDLVQPLAAQATAMEKEVEALEQEHGADVDAMPTAAANRVREVASAVMDLRRQRWLATIGVVMIRVAEWPFDNAKPLPTDPTTWTPFPDPVLRWLAEDALTLIRGQIHGPKSGNSSSLG